MDTKPSIRGDKEKKNRQRSARRSPNTAARQNVLRTILGAKRSSPSFRGSEKKVGNPGDPPKTSRTTGNGPRERAQAGQGMWVCGVGCRGMWFVFSRQRPIFVPTPRNLKESPRFWHVKRGNDRRRPRKGTWPPKKAFSLERRGEKATRECGACPTNALMGGSKREIARDTSAVD